MSQIALPLQHASVCSGVEAVTVAWKPLGLTPVWFSEITPFPCAVLARQVLDESIPAPAILIGGTPCQACNIAGFRAGLADARGALTLTFVELANAIDQVRTRRHEPEAIIVWESVPCVLTDKGNAFGCLLAALTGEENEFVPPRKAWSHAGIVFGPQRTIAWRVLDTQYFGLAQRRRRVFLVASACVELDPAAVLFESESPHRNVAPYRTPQAKAVFPVEAGMAVVDGMSNGQVGAETALECCPTLTCNHDVAIVVCATTGSPTCDTPTCTDINNLSKGADACLIWLGKRLLSALSKSGVAQEGIDH